MNELTSLRQSVRVLSNTLTLLQTGSFPGKHAYQIHEAQVFLKSLVKTQEQVIKDLEDQLAAKDVK